MTDRLNNHLFGIATESQFDAKCQSFGITSFRPVSDQTSVDRVVVTPNGPIAIQIKSARTLAKDIKGRGRISWCYKADNCRRNGSHFVDTGISFIAIYVEPLDRWHILPASECQGNRIRIRINPTGKILRSIENWALLGAQNRPIGKIASQVGSG